MSVDEEMKKLDKDFREFVSSPCYTAHRYLKDVLRQYLFVLSIDGKDDVIEKTTLTREITWTKNEITIDTLVTESSNSLYDFINMKKLKVSFLDRTGNRIMDDSFDIKGLKYKHPLKVSQEDGVLIYRLVFEY